MLSVQKAFYTLDQRTPSPYHSTLWVSSNQVPPNRYPGVSRNGTFDIADLRGGYAKNHSLATGYSTRHSPKFEFFEIDCY
ncbi:BBM_1a_G0036270.mRNA.1.CDS.1 [Saccharomyces cerevisiae]|nr:BBM_1a_G0036270.mRNA.1.CDS.1 [Saccharomyces cerevisiae]CAI7231327.1 BBM_1a_G0036270.mRNA.1.CDS.1 [Saccharomyces cerevisiae]